MLLGERHERTGGGRRSRVAPADERELSCSGGSSGACASRSAVAEAVEQDLRHQGPADPAGREVEGGGDVLDLDPRGELHPGEAARGRLAMTKVAALEHAQERIRVNAICPGPVRTPMSEEEGDASVDVTPIQRRAEPERSPPPSPSWSPTTPSTSPAPSSPSIGGYLAR